DRLAFPGVPGDARERVIEVGGLLVDVARAQAHVDHRLAALDVEGKRAGRGRMSMLEWRHSMLSEQAPASVAASGCAPPMPPRPAVRIHLPVSSPPWCWRPISTKVS